MLEVYFTTDAKETPKAKPKIETKEDKKETPKESKQKMFIADAESKNGLLMIKVKLVVMRPRNSTKQLRISERKRL